MNEKLSLHDFSFSMKSAIVGDVHTSTLMLKWILSSDSKYF